MSNIAHLIIGYATVGLKTSCRVVEAARRLQTQFDMLTGQASSLSQGRRARVAATSTFNGQLASIEDGLYARNLRMNTVLRNMVATAQELAHYDSGDEDSIYLAY